MLPKKLRLSRKDVLLVLKKGRHYYSPHIFLIFLPSQTLPNSQWLIKVAKKAIPKATARNRIKRIIRETVRQLNSEMKITGQGIIKINSKIDSMQNNLLAKEVAELLNKIA
jgi:ribonuclease P protein component